MQYYQHIFLLCLIFAIVHAQQVCIENLECFSTEAPWISLTRPVPPPEGLDVVKVDYALYTRNTVRNPHYVNGESNNWGLSGTDFDPRRNMVMFIHGWKGKGNDSWVTSVAEAFLKNMDANVFLVDYGSIKDQDYLKAASNARVVGAMAAKYVKYLIEYEGVTPSRMHIIGISLGAHVAAYVAKRIPGVARLTGLDPAQPLFEGESKEVRFDKDDAQFVDVAHTNGRPAVPLGGLGFNSPIGHVDFYFNGGWNQPGCSADVAGSVFKAVTEGKYNLWESWPDRLLCPHIRVLFYYLEALNNPNCTFWGTKREDFTALLTILSRGWLSRVFSSLANCNIDSCSPFGLRTFDFPARGSFDIATSDSSPYCINSQSIDEMMEKKLIEYRTKQHL